MEHNDTRIFVDDAWKQTKLDFTEFEKNLLQSIVGSTRVLVVNEGEENQGEKQIKILSVISLREKTILYEAVLIDGTVEFPIVVKSTIKYTEVYNEQLLIEELLYKLNPDTHFESLWDEEFEKYILSDSLRAQLEPLLERERKYPTYVYEKNVLDKEYEYNKVVWDKAIELGREEYAYKTFGIYTDKDQPIVHYLMEKLQPFEAITAAHLSESNKDSVDFDTMGLNKLAVDVINCLSLIHQSQILHLDLTPMNIMVKGEKYVVIDFGVSIGDYKISLEEHDEVKLYRGNPLSAARQSYFGKYRRSNDLESLVYILEMAAGNKLSWASEQQSRDDEEIYAKKSSFTPKDSRVCKLWNYINEVNENDAEIDYDRCLGFFL